MLYVDETVSKTGNARALPLVPEVVQALRVQAANKQPDDALFAFPEPITIRKDFDRAKIPKVDDRGRTAGFYSIRKGLATFLSGRGVDIGTIASLLGHTDPRMTIGHYVDSSSAQVLQASQLTACARKNVGSDAESYLKQGREVDRLPVAMQSSTTQDRSAPRRSPDQDCMAASQSGGVRLNGHNAAQLANSPHISNPGSSVGRAPRTDARASSHAASGVVVGTAEVDGSSPSPDVSPCGPALVDDPAPRDGLGGVHGDLSDDRRKADLIIYTLQRAGLIGMALAATVAAASRQTLPIEIVSNHAALVGR